MPTNSTGSEILFIGNDIEMRVVFGNALSNLGQMPATYFSDAVTAGEYLSRHGQRLKTVYMNVGKNPQQCLQDIILIRAIVKNAECRIVMLDSNSALRDTAGIMSVGADEFLSKPYDYRNLRRALSYRLSAGNGLNKPVSTIHFHF